MSIYLSILGAAFELGHQERFALWHLFTSQEILHLPGFLKLFSLRNLTSGLKNVGLNNENATSWTIAAQKLSNRRVYSG